MVLLHLVIIILVYLSPFLLDWRLIVLGIGIYYFQLLFLGNCVLTMWQFKEKARDTTFYSFILSKVGFNPDKKKVRIIVDYVIPWVILLVALTWQILFGHVVLLSR